MAEQNDGSSHGLKGKSTITRIETNGKSVKEIAQMCLKGKSTITRIETKTQIS